jgi:hypothetical protein
LRVKNFLDLEKKMQPPTRKQYPLLLDLAFLREGVSYDDLSIQLMVRYSSFISKLEKEIQKGRSWKTFLESIRRLYDQHFVNIKSDLIIEPLILKSFLEKLQEVAREGDILVMPEFPSLYLAEKGQLRIYPLQEQAENIWVLPPEAGPILQKYDLYRKEQLAEIYQGLNIIGIYTEEGQLIKFR